MHVTPILPVNDLAEAEAFHRALGLDVERYDDAYAWCSLDGHEVWHLAVHRDLDAGHNATAVYVHVEDVEVVRARLAAGDLEVGEAVDEPWGMREFAVVDPSGNRIRVGQHAQ